MCFRRHPITGDLLYTSPVFIQGRSIVTASDMICCYLSGIHVLD